MRGPLGEYAAASTASCTWEEEHAMADLVYDVPAVVKPSKLRKLCQAVDCSRARRRARMAAAAGKSAA